MKKLISALIIVCILTSLTQAASVISWGSVALNSKELAAKDFVAIAAGGNHSLALKKYMRSRS